MSDDRKSEAIGDPSRVWEHRLHEDLAFNERQNYFLIAEAMFVTAYATTSSGQIAATSVGRIIAITGLVMTLAWLIVNRRQRQLVEHIHKRALDVCEEFEETYQTRPPSRLRSHILLAYFMPLALVVMWSALLIVDL